MQDARPGRYLLRYAGDSGEEAVTVEREDTGGALFVHFDGGRGTDYLGDVYADGRAQLVERLADLPEVVS